MDKEKKIYIFMAIAAALGLIGFIVVFIQLNSLGARIGLLSEEMSLFQSPPQTAALQSSPLSDSSGSAAPTSSQANQGGATVSPAASSGAPGIPTSIVFYVTSTLDSQAPDQIMIAIENVSKSGSQLTVNFKVYNKGQENGAIDPSSLIEFFDQAAGSSDKGSVNGNFSLIAPQNSSGGSLTFIVDPSQNSAILQTGSSDNPVFYKFDFSSQSYQETIVG